VGLSSDKGAWIKPRADSANAVTVVPRGRPGGRSYTTARFFWVRGWGAGVVLRAGDTEE
jgi:hypothetical protein